MGKVTAPNGTPDNLSVCIRFIRGIRVRLTRTRTRTRMRFLSSFSYSKKTTSGSCRATPPQEGILSGFFCGTTNSQSVLVRFIRGICVPFLLLLLLLLLLFLLSSFFFL